MGLAASNSTLFERLGGSGAVQSAVGAFYFNVLNDPRLAHLFSGVDINRLRRHQEHFLTFAFGGPVNYSGRGMAAAHQRLVEEHGLNDSHFDALLQDLDKTLTDLDIERHLITDVLNLVESLRADVLGLEQS